MRREGEGCELCLLSGKHTGILTPLHYESTGSLLSLHYKSTGFVLYQISDKSQLKKVFFLALTNTDFLPRTNADFLPRITGGGRQKLFDGNWGFG